MSAPCRIDSPIPFARNAIVLPPNAADDAAFSHARQGASIDCDDGARTPRARIQHAITPPCSPALRLPVYVLGTSLPTSRPCPEPLLAQRLVCVAPTRFEAHMSVSELNALLQRLWHDVRAEAMQQSHVRVRLLRPDDDVVRYTELSGAALDGQPLDAGDFAWLVASRLAHQHYTIVAEHDGVIIGSAAMLIESRLANSYALVGHLDDIFVAEPWRAARLGPSLVEVLTALGDRLGVCQFALAYDWRSSQGPVI